MTWKPYPKIKPPKKCDYLVYIDKANSNSPDIIDVQFFDGETWLDVDQSYCPVIFWKPLPAPPKGSWMSMSILPPKSKAGGQRAGKPTTKGKT